MSLRPLLGLRVAEIGSSISTSFGARLLSDLGVEVVKIEPPEGDAVRRQAPFLASGDSALHVYLNAGKRSVVAGSKSDLASIVQASDVVIVSADEVSDLPEGWTNPADPARPTAVIVTPFGLSGPRASWTGSEFIAQHSGGYAYHQACPVSDPETLPPTGCADREAALLVGLVVANAALWAISSERAGAPKPLVDLSAEDVFAYMLVDPLADYHRGTQPPGRGRVPGQGITIAGGLVWLLPCSDGTILVSPREDHQWQRWVELMGAPAWTADADLCGTREVRTRNARALQSRMAEWSKNEKAHEVFARAQAARVACFPVSTAEDLIRNPQLAARRFFNVLKDSDGCEISLPGLPFAMFARSDDALPRGQEVQCPALGGASEQIARNREQPRFAARDEGKGERRPMAKLPLAGVRVVDFSWVMAGPMATKTLGAMGAEIIKIESSLRPEFSFREAWFAVINNNKKSCMLDITKPEAQACIRDIVATSDVVVENFSARVLAKNNLAYEDVVKVKPDIIFVSASGLGRTGPERDLLAYGSLLQAYSGRVNLMGRMNPELEGMGVMPAWTDPVTSLWETLAIQAALKHRQTTGEGCYIDLSMLEATVALLPDAILRASLGQPSDERGSESELGASPSGCFRCNGDDDWLALSIRSNAEWAALCRAMRRPDLAERPSLATVEGRWAAKADLDHEVAIWCLRRSAAEREAHLQAHGVPAARTRGIYDLVADKHVAERGVFRRLEDGSWTTTLPWMDADGWRGTFTPTPKLGSHNDYVFGEILKVSRAKQDELKEKGIIR